MSANPEQKVDTTPKRPTTEDAGDSPSQKHRLSSKSKPMPAVVDAGSSTMPALTHPDAPLPKDPEPHPASRGPHHGSTEGDLAVEQSLQRITSARRKAFVQVLDYGVTAEQGTRPTMEDQHTMLAEGIPFFGVYDGHGGTSCAEYLRDKLHSLILGHPDIRTNPEKAIRDGIVQADHDFLYGADVDTNESGCVCAVALIIDDKLVIGNVGDCEAILCRNDTPIVLTVKHNLKNNPSEVERVRAAGGKIFQNRVGHPQFNPSVLSLAVTRAIGDAGFKLDEFTHGKPSGVIAEPATKTVQLTNEDEFIVIGCDGLWDVMTYDRVVDFCTRRFAEKQSAQSIAEELARAALDNGSTDNVTAMLVYLARGSQSTAKRHASNRDFIPEAAVSSSSR